jgi:predicted RNA-binding protein associated with RNAse of E/G family
VLWWPPGTIYQLAAIADRAHALKLLADGGWTLEDKTWWGGPAIHIIPTGAPYSLWPYRTAEGNHVAWYCNLQAPLTRTADGFDTNDWTLDVVASPDLSSWQWKDEDELVEGHRVGLYSDDDVARIRDAGRQVIELIESRAPIFDEWREWQPPG